MINWSRWYLAGFSTSKVLFSSFHMLFIRNESLSSAHLKGRRIQLHLLEGKRSTYILYYLELYKEDSCFLPHLCIYSIVSLYQYEFMDIYFILWIIIQYDFTLLVAQKLILYISCPIGRIIHFSKKP